MYQMVLQPLNTPGIAIALFYLLTCALRLARFNVKAYEGVASTHFVGLPTPAAAGILASFALSYELFESGQEVTVKTIPLIMEKMPFMFKCIPAVILVISLLMVSSVPYAAMKNMKMNKPKSFQLFILLVIGIILIISYPQNTIFIIFLLYLLSGIMGYIWRYIRLRQSLSLSARINKKTCEQPADPKDDLTR